jgi:tRNA pseudouridine32 synthase / 23S rRNA pseudouridine746 synthase
MQAAQEPMPPLRMLYADDQVVVVEKPPKLLSVPGRGEAGAINLASQVQGCYADALTVHRLDMATSGLMVFARGAQAQRVLNRAFEQRLVSKQYLALVEGWLAQDDGEVNAPLLVDWPNRPRQVVNLAAGKPSLTRWRVAARSGAGDTARTRMELVPVTGRSHQLRVHMQAIGHPIVGDELYGTPPLAHERLLLHASAISFPHPAHGQTMHFESAAPF